MSDFDKISMPVVAKAYPPLYANNIVGVQPLLGPTGLVYYLRFRYSSSQSEPIPELILPKSRTIFDPWEVSKEDYL